MWGKRPKPNGKGLRCRVALSFGKNKLICLCDRPARRYACEKNGYDLGASDVCKNHKAMYERQGMTMTLIDRRKKMA